MRASPPEIRKKRAKKAALRELERSVDRLTTDGLISDARAAEIISAAEAVATQLSLLPAMWSPGPIQLVPTRRAMRDGSFSIGAIPRQAMLPVKVGLCAPNRFCRILEWTQYAGSRADP